MDKQTLKKMVCDAIDNNRDRIIALGESIFNEPELGYKEFKTAQKVKDVLDELGYAYKDQQAVTGVIAEVPGRNHNAKVALMGELDAVVCANHPNADPVTAAAHACGHNVQVASVMGVAMALKESGVMDYLDGDVSLMAVPSEECVELAFRNQLRKEGKISFLGGKQEFLALGLMDDIDCMVMQHTWMGDTCSAGGPGGMGFVGKIVTYKGRASHGAMPQQGINALTAARIGLGAVDSIRETFYEEDNIRWHPIITRGGDLVNVVPETVTIESFVRGNKLEAIKDANFRINRALKAGADAIGAECIIDDLPGYLFFNEELQLRGLVEDNLKELVGEDKIFPGVGLTTDANDLSYVLPCCHAMIGGAAGIGHGADYRIENPDLAYITAAKMMAMTVVDLLFDGAKQAREIKDNFKPLYTKEQYLDEWGNLKV